MAVDKTVLLETAPEFSGLSDTEINRAIADAELQCWRDWMGDLADRYVVLTAAHGLSLNHPGARPGEYDPHRYLVERERLAMIRHVPIVV